MTVTTTLDRQYFDGDGSNKVFPFNFRFFTNDQIYVSLIAPDGTITPQFLTTNYTLAGALQAGGGTVTMNIAPPFTMPATRVFVQRILPQVQPTSIRNQGKFYPEIHEDAFDRLTMLIQQALAGLANALQLTFSKTGWNFLGYKGINVGTPTDPTDAATKGYVDSSSQDNNSYTDAQILRTVRGGAGEVLTQLPPAASRANKVMGFDADGQPIGVLPASGSGTELAIDLANPVDPNKGSAMIGWERGPAGLTQIKDVRGKLNTLEVSPWEFADLTTNRVNPLDPYTWNWSAAFQAMCNAHLRISVDGRYNLPAKVTLRPGAVLVGRGNMISAIKGPASGPAFELLNPNGVTLVESPKFYDFTLECGTGSGIRLNSKTGGFTDNATTQSYMMRPVVDGVIFVGTITAGNFALDFNKCFNGSVVRSRLTGFDCAADFLGCDLNIIGGQPNRFMSNNTHARIRSAGTFGSGTRLIGNDMLHAKVKAVESSDRDFSMGDNYFEQTAADPQLAELFDIEAGLHAHLYDNRVDCAAAQAISWLKVTGDFYSLSVHGNHTSGPTWGDAVFNGGAGSRYHASTINRQTITHSGNASEVGFPFNTIPDDTNMPGRFKSAWHMYPGVGGLAAGGNPLVRVVNNKFVLPYSAANYYRFTKGGEPLTGNVHVYIKASAAIPGELLVCQRRDGLSPVATVNQALTATPTWYQVFTNVAVNDLNMYFLNSAVDQGDLYLHELIVDYA